MALRLATVSFFRHKSAVTRLRRTRQRPRGANALVLIVCLTLVAAVPEQMRAQAPDLDAIAPRLADAILSLSRGLIVKPSVVVADFVETHGNSNEMGKALARQLSMALAKNARDFVVADSNGEFDTAGTGRLPSQPAADAAVNCATGKPKPTFVVDGDMDELQDRVVVRIKATRTEDNKAVFDERVTLPMTPELKALESRLPSATEKVSGGSGPTWVRPGFQSRG